MVHYGSSNLKSEENQAIFHICVQLRQILGINQKVELVKETVKKYFYYWLEMASISIERQCVEGQKLIVVLEGLNNFQDNGETSIT